MSSAETRAAGLLAGGESVQVTVTHEGVIIDCVDSEGSVMGTFCKTFEELREWLVGPFELDGAGS